MRAAEMLSTTAELVGGQRAQDYGDKTVNHKRISDLWNMWLENRTPMMEGSDILDNQVYRGNPANFILMANDYEHKSTITTYDVAMMMLLVKIARLMNSPGHQDSHIDVSGYASILEEIANGEC
jgi:hypothetical protein